MYFNNERNYSYDAEINGEQKLSILEGIQKNLKGILVLGHFKRESESFF